MALFGKSIEDSVNKALERIRGQFPNARVSATVQDKVVTLRGDAPDMATKTAIMSAFNDQVKTDNTINQITVATAAGTNAPSASSPSGLGPGSSVAAPAANGGERIHEVAAGDTLSALAKRYYGNASEYQKIFQANRDQLNDPDKIKVGQRLKIPG